MKKSADPKIQSSTTTARPTTGGNEYQKANTACQHAPDDLGVHWELKQRGLKIESERSSFLSKEKGGLDPAEKGASGQQWGALGCQPEHYGGTLIPQREGPQKPAM